MNEMIMRARYFAAGAHGGVDQRRKYTNDPYINHPIEVMEILSKSGITDSYMLQAALLHDVLEDTDVSSEMLLAMFGDKVHALVRELTNVSKPSDGNRAVRKEIDRRALAEASAAAQTVKCADIISNSKSIAEYDPKFAPVYIKEMEDLLEVLTKADPRLLMAATHAVQSAKYMLPADAK
jgi:(p)ppGpp synthase/HD superfamily hydrolase